MSPRGHRRLSAPADRQLSFPTVLAFARGTPGRCRLPVWPGPPLTPPVKETLSTTQNAFRLVSFPQAFACGPTPRALSVKITCEARTPISPSTCHRPRQRSNGFLPARSRPRRTQPFDHVSSLHACFMLARASYGLPCGYPWVATQDASDRLLLPYHSTPSTRVSSTSAVVARLSPDAPRRTVRFTTLRSASVGPSFPCDCRAEKRSLLFQHAKSRTSGTPVASPADARDAFARTSRSGTAKIASIAPP